MDSPLAGIRILDMTRYLSGPYATLLLAEMGAEVIKVEETGIGDDTRRIAPLKGGVRYYHSSVNVNLPSTSSFVMSESNAAADPRTATNWASRVDSPRAD